MTNGNDKLLKKDRNMDKDAENRILSDRNQGTGLQNFNDDKVIDPAGLSGGDTKGR